MSIESLREQAQISFDHALAKRNLQQRLEARLSVIHNGGVFAVNKEQILFLYHYHSIGITDLVILDDYQTPVSIKTLELYRLMTSRYQEIMNEWLLEWENLKKVRTAKNV